jgi:argonaute-like protein implicated in RNA metabolism and viral defense
MLIIELNFKIKQTIFNFRTRPDILRGKRIIIHRDIVKQINDLSYLYYGSIGDTNLPITTYSSHKISKMMKHGISFENIKIENIYFWI